MLLYDLSAKNDVKLSPYVWRVRAALRHKGLTFDEQALAFSDIEAVTSYKTVPVLVDNGVKYHDSFEIIRYLDKTYSAKPVMGNVAECRFFESWCLMTLHSPLAQLVLKDIYDVVHDKDRAYFKESREKRFNISLETVQNGRENRLEAFRALLNPVRKTLLDSPFLSGKSPHYFDYCLWGTLRWAKSVATIELFAADDPIEIWYNAVTKHLGF